MTDSGDRQRPDNANDSHPAWLYYLTHPTTQAIGRIARMALSVVLAIVITWLGIAQSLYRQNAEIRAEAAEAREQASEKMDELREEHAAQIAEMSRELS